MDAVCKAPAGPHRRQ